MTTMLDGKEFRQMHKANLPVCVGCRHWYLGTGECKAFPEGIPAGIFTYGESHHKPYPGDHGIRFESIGKPKP